MPISRRAVLGLLSGSTFFLTALRGMTADMTDTAAGPPLAFPQGVASGDPRPDAIMLWTRAVPPAGTEPDGVPLTLQLSRDPQFNRPLVQARLSTGSASDYTVRAYVDGLEADSWYYYRFLGGEGSVSITGRTRTAPAPGQERETRLAFVSCQNYEDAWYGSWARLLADDLAAPAEDQVQLVLHLGDFIYERCWETRPDGGAMSRRVPPFPDGVNAGRSRYATSLADYRHLYKTYLSDPHLQAARARWPFVCTWDDHEFANNNFQSYTTYGDRPILQARRREAANQAWFEYIPAVLDQLDDQPAHGFRPAGRSPGETDDNRAACDTLCIYRKLEWGSNLDLVITDSRSYRSAPCVPADLAGRLDLPLNSVELVAIADAGRDYADGNPPATLPYGDGTVANPGRDREPGSLLGLAQRDWLLATLGASGARWKIWANALPLLPLRLDLSALPFAGYRDSIFTIDSWSGYPHEVSHIMRQLARQKVTGVVSLSGDHHMHAAGTIRHSTTAPGAAPVMADFTIAGVSSSPMFEELVATARRDHPGFQPIVYAEAEGGVTPVWNMTMLDGVFAAFTYARTGLRTLARWLGPNHANPGLAYVDTTANGYGLARLSASEMQVQMVTMTDCRTPFSEAPGIRHIARFRLPAWGDGEAPVLEGPEFERGAPFPFPPPTV